MREGTAGGITPAVPLRAYERLPRYEHVSGRPVASGVYVVRFNAGAVHDGMKVALVR